MLTLCLKPLVSTLPFLSPTILKPLHLIHFTSSNKFRAMSTAESTQRIFQLRFDPLTGNSEWVVIDETEPPELETHKPLLATSYLDMLNDSPRNRAFREAIDKTITKPCHVLDIGAGTGLLSMMAARALFQGDHMTASGSGGWVTACESYLPMVKLMRKVLRANGLAEKIHLINKRSDELRFGVDITSLANILVSEILDSELLGEGLIPTLQHAHENLLVENPRTVPHCATIYGQFVESPYLWQLHDLVSNDARASDGVYLVPDGKNSILRIRQKQFAMHCDAISDEIKLLSEPFKVFDFDFWKRPDSCRETELHVKATLDGTIHAVISWWILQLDSEGTVFYCTGPKWITNVPGVGNWCDHWKQCVWFLPEGGFSVCKDEVVNFAAQHSESSFTYKFESSSGYVRRCVLSTLENSIFLTPERTAIYGDSNWRCSLIKAIKNALQQKVTPMCIVADDSVFLAAAVASLAKTSHVIACFPGLREKGENYLKAVSFANGYSMDQVEVLKSSTHLVTMQDTHQRKVDLLIGEPFYYGTDGLLPWQNLRFWKQRSALAPVLAEDALIMPCKGILRACAFSLPDLWRSRCCLKAVEGFDHSVVNSTLGACGDLPPDEDSPCLPYFIWQCGESKKLSNIFSIMEFDFLKPISPCSGAAQVEFGESGGICHGFVLWIDWVMDVDAAIEISTGPDKRYWKQAVKLLKKPVVVGSRDSSSAAEISASFDPSSGDVTINYVFS